MDVGQKKEEIKNNSFETTQVLASLALIVGVFVYLFYLPDPLTLTHKTLWKLKVLGYSVWQIYMDERGRDNRNEDSIGFQDRKTKNEQDVGRGLASTPVREDKDIFQGVISKDLWGNPYYFKINKKTESLYVWSSGPNGQNESLKISEFSFKGDDIGLILDLKMR